MQQTHELHLLTATVETCTPCTLGIHSCCAAHGACRCDVAGHPMPVAHADRATRQGTR